MICGKKEVFWRKKRLTGLWDNVMIKKRRKKWKFQSFLGEFYECRTLPCFLRFAVFSRIKLFFFSHPVVCLYIFVGGIARLAAPLKIGSRPITPRFVWRRGFSCLRERNHYAVMRNPAMFIKLVRERPIPASLAKSTCLRTNTKVEKGMCNGSV